MPRFVAYDLTERVQNCKLSLRDEYGPEVAVGIFDSKTENFCGGFVGHNTSLCPPDERIWNGGIRDVTSPEWLNKTPTEQLDLLSWHLARPMTFKQRWCYSRNARPSAPFWGGGKAIMVRKNWNGAREDFIRYWAEALSHYRLPDGRPILGGAFIGGADAGLNEDDLALICEANGSTHCVTGGPGQLQYEKDGVTGLILLHAARSIMEHLRIPWKRARLAIHGFGNVGRGIAQWLAKPEYRGARLIAVSNKSKPNERGIASEDGLDPEALIRLAQESSDGISSAVKELDAIHFDAGEKLEGWRMLRVDVLFLAAPIENLLDGIMENEPHTSIILSGTNSGITENGYKRLHERGAVAPCDFMVNMGAASMAKSSWHGLPREQCFDFAFRAIEDNLGWALYESQRQKRSIFDVTMEETLSALDKANK